MQGSSCLNGMKDGAEGAEDFGASPGAALRVHDHDDGSPFGDVVGTHDSVHDELKPGPSDKSEQVDLRHIDNVSGDPEWKVQRQDGRLSPSPPQKA